MNNRFFLVTIFGCALLGISAIAAQFDLPVQRIGNTDFYIYKVTSKETIYGISKKLDISKDDILKYNPSAIDGLKNNQTLFFPVNEFKKPIVKEISEERPTEFHHVVDPGETLYGLSKLYNISQDDIIKANPIAIDGVKIGQVLIIPQKSTLAKSDNANKNIVFHTIKKGDTLYNISKKYNTTLESLLSLNPGISPESFKIDDVIKIQPDIAKAAPPVAVQTPVTEFYAYRISKDDTYYSIAKKHGVSVEEIMQANPHLDKLKKNEYIYIPKISESNIGHQDIVSKEVGKEILQIKVKEIYDSIHPVEKKQSIDVALLLPYMLNSSKQDKQANLYIEFYKGFLIAVDSVRKAENKKINIYTYDTENSLDKVISIISKPELKKMDLIFVPDDTQQIDTIAQFAKKNKINLINSFSIKNEGYTDNEHFFQVNIPHSQMFADVIREFKNKFGDREIIFLTNSSVTEEEKDLTKEMKKYIAEHKNIIFHDIKFNGKLQLSDIENILQANSKYVIVPTTGSKRMVSKINGTLKALKTDRTDIDFVLLGYPEWSTYLNDYTETFQKIDTYIYSRFFANPTDTNFKDFENKFKNWYGNNMILAAPQFGLLGFDCGMYFLNAVSENGNDFNKAHGEYHGIQNDFDFERLSNWSGFINKSLYFVHFTPYYTIEKIR
ncbi:MAG: LysM peptidoglycan-binding domain-containing protein [Muribaculaceae bacterium]